jgi:hypothetical protein
MGVSFVGDYKYKYNYDKIRKKVKQKNFIE